MLEFRNGSKGVLETFVSGRVRISNGVQNFS